MPTYNPKQLGEPEVIREINPTVLCAFLQPFEGYLRTRGLEIKEPSRIDTNSFLPTCKRIGWCLPDPSLFSLSRPVPRR